MIYTLHIKNLSANHKILRLVGIRKCQKGFYDQSKSLAKIRKENS